MIRRINIGIFGKVNAGKSTLMNLLTQQNSSIVDPTPGTTTDIKVSHLEIHALGPVKLFDTAGFDEGGELGEKKRKKTLSCFKECDLILLVIDLNASLDLSQEEELYNLAGDKQFLVILNLFKEISTEALLHFKKRIPALFLAINLNQNSTGELFSFLEKYIALSETKSIFPFLKEGDIAFFNVPMDEETPHGRLLRPQSTLQEQLLQRYVSTFVYRMNLDPQQREKERKRFKEQVDLLKASKKLRLIITDSQAVDLVDEWEKEVDITTFSVAMTYLKSPRYFSLFVQGIHSFLSLQKGDRVLIAEACNHNRIKEDIGTVQIPTKINRFYGEGYLHIDHLFGREMADIDLREYKLVVHCGGCMIDHQKIRARLEDMIASNVPFTNYGMLLSYLSSPTVLKRVLSVFCT